MVEAVHPSVFPVHAHPCFLRQLSEDLLSILGKQGLSQSVHSSQRQLKEFLLGYIARNNENPRPFVWTKSPEKLQHIIEATKDYQAAHPLQTKEAPQKP